MVTEEQRTVYAAIADIIAKHGTISARKISEYLKKDYGIKRSHTMILRDLKKDLDSLSKKDIDNKKGHILKNIEELAKQCYNMAMAAGDDNVRLRAMDTYNKIIKTQASVLSTFEKAKVKLAQAEKPTYNIFIGEPREADLSEIEKIRKKEEELEDDDDESIDQNEREENGDTEKDNGPDNSVE